MYVCVYEWMDGYETGQPLRARWMEGWMDAWMAGLDWMGWIDGWMHGWTRDRATLLAHPQGQPLRARWMDGCMYGPTVFDATRPKATASQMSRFCFC